MTDDYSTSKFDGAVSENETIVDNKTEVYDPVYDIRFQYTPESWLSYTLRIVDNEPIQLSKDESLALYEVLRRVRNRILDSGFEK